MEFEKAESGIYKIKWRPQKKSSAFKKDSLIENLAGIFRDLTHLEGEYKNEDLLSAVMCTP